MHDILKNGFHFGRIQLACSHCLQPMVYNRTNWTWLVNFASIMDFYLSNEKVLAHVYARRHTQRRDRTKRNRDPPLPKRVVAGVQSIEPNANKKCDFDCFIFNILMFFLPSLCRLRYIFSPSNDCGW